MAVLYETDKLILDNKYESAFLRDIITGEILLEEDFYGDPQCGLIDDENRWAIIAGDHVTLWTSTSTKTIQIEGMKGVHALRLKKQGTVEILIDPWSDNASIWELNIEAFEITKIRDFDDYKKSEFTDEIIW